MEESFFDRFLLHAFPYFQAAFSEQHLYRHKTMDEYYEWKRRNDEDLQRALQDHPVAAQFLRLSKNVNEYNVEIVK